MTTYWILSSNYEYKIEGIYTNREDAEEAFEAGIGESLERYDVDWHGVVMGSYYVGEHRPYPRALAAGWIRP